MESSRQDLLNDMAEHKPTLKNKQNTYQPRFGFTPKTGILFQRGFVFTVKPLFSLTCSIQECTLFFRSKEDEGRDTVYPLVHGLIRQTLE